LRLLQLVLVLVLLNGEEKVALFDELAVLVMKLLEIALDAGDQLDRLYGRGIAGNVDKAADTLNPGFHHRDRRDWLRRELRPGHARDRGRRSRYLGRRRRGHIEWPWIENRRDVSGSNADQRR